MNHTENGNGLFAGKQQYRKDFCNKGEIYSLCQQRLDMRTYTR